MKGVRLLIGLLLVVAVVVSCAPAATPTPVVIEKKVVETQVVEKVVEATKVVEKVVMVTPTPAPPNPYRPEKLFELSDKLKAALAGKPAPPNARYAIVANILVPFWTACQIGAARAGAELAVPVVFQAPVVAGSVESQVSMLESFVADKYTGISFSAISPKSVEDIVARGMAQGTHFVAMDSDSPESKRYIYIGMSDYNAGKAAAEAALKIIGKGKVVGLVGFATAQNAINRMAGIQDTLKGTDIQYLETLFDDADPAKALSNAETALTKYPDLAGFITIYSYDGPAAGQAVKAAGKAGKVKIIAFDLEPETQKLMKEGVIQAAIGQRVYFYGYLSVYILHAMATLGPQETLKILDPYLIVSTLSKKRDHLDTGVDVVYANELDLYKQYLDSIGIASQ
jgi:ribose transport system substrate-binding protein